MLAQSLFVRREADAIVPRRSRFSPTVVRMRISRRSMTCNQKRIEIRHLGTLRVRTFKITICLCHNCHIVPCLTSKMGSNSQNLTNYAAFVDPETGSERIGHLDPDKQTLQPLSFTSGTPIANLYQVIEAGSSNIEASGSVIPAGSVKLLPPISGRDVLAVGKNYMEHAKEFNSSGYDSSDKVDKPSHPVIFTKRATSIIATGEEISPHQGFTETVDYEGEIGVIIGKPGYQIKEQDAWNHVWGYTIINDVTARERQRDHKQFYIGKSPDTFCPMVSEVQPLKGFWHIPKDYEHV